MKTRRSILSIFVALFFVMTTGFCLTTAFASDSDTAPSVNVTLTEAAAVRNEEPYGIMFKANVNADELTEYYGEDVIFGMLICPADFVTESKPLEIGVENGLVEYNPAVDGESAPANSYRNVTATPTDGVYCCNLINIKTENLSRPYMARAYVGIKNGDSYEYTYSNAFARSIYTVATYALANNDLLADTDETKLDENAVEYLTGVVNTVQEVYTELTVNVSNKVFDGENNFTVSATVSNGTRTLESCVKLSSNNIVQTDVDSYNANVLGEFTATAVVGNKEVTVEGFNCKTINYAVKESFNEYAYNGSSKAVLTDVDGEIGGVLGATHWDSVGNETPTLGIAEKIKSQAKNDVYLSFDYYVDYNETDNATDKYPQNGRLLFFEFFDSNLNENLECYLYAVSAPYTFTNADSSLVNCADGDIISYKLLDMYGISSAQNGVGHIYDTWVKIEIQFHRDFSVEDITRIDFAVLRSFDDGVYLKNVKLSTEPTKQVAKVTTIFDSADDVSNFVAKDTTKTTFSYLNNYEGVDNVLVLSPANGVTDSDGNFTFSSDAAKNITMGTYLYMDIYMPYIASNYKINYALYLSFNGAPLIYNTLSGTCNGFKYQFYDLDGNPYTTENGDKPWWQGDTMRNKWVRLEINIISHNWDSTNNNMFFGAYSPDKNPLLGNVYFSNVKVSTLPLDFSVFAE